MNEWMEWLVTRYSNCFIIILFILFLSVLVPLLRTLNDFKLIPVCHLSTTKRNFYVNCVHIIITCKASETFPIYFLFHDIENIKGERLFFILFHSDHKW